jgi:4-hydroxy-tetrahydrodipicolinate reductase
MSSMSSKESQQTERLRVAVSGALGRMGNVTCKAVAADPELLLTAAVDPAFAAQAAGSKTDLGAGYAVPTFTSMEAALADGDTDVVVDFSTPDAVKRNVALCIERRVAVVVGTTGLSPGDLADLDRQAGEGAVPVLVAPNFAMGAVLMMQFAELAAKHLRACEIVELHHEAKLDAPSGTSRLTRLRIEDAWRECGFEKEVPIHSIRLPGLVAHQEVIFGGTGETLTIRHDSLNRESFMPGVVLAVKRVRALQGLVVGLENIL